MKDYSRLTNRGKLTRLRGLALSALSQYGMEESRLDYHGFETNLLYRVTSHGGDRYMLRLASPGWRTREDLVNEALWLEALAKWGEVKAPRVVPALSGERVLALESAQVPDPRYATLFSYLPGRSLENFLTEPYLRKMGILMARLHVHGGEWNRPADFTNHSFEHYLSRGEEERLFSPEVMAERPRRETEYLYAVRDLVEEEYAGLNRKDLRVIHCDLWHGNIRVHRGDLLPFDFEDTILGFRLHDMAMAMLDLREDTDEKGYPVLLDAFRRGYESVLDWPEGNMENLQAGRVLWQMNWLARFWPEGLEKRWKGKLAFLSRLTGKCL